LNGPKLLTYSSIREHDQQLAHQISTVRSNFTPDNTVIFSADWRFIAYYLPEYALASVEIGGQGEASEGELTTVDFDRVSADWFNTRAIDEWFIVVMNPELLPFVDAPVESLTTETSPSAAYITLQPHEVLVYEDGRFRVEDAS
jgi:hypothetical protein